MDMFLEILLLVHDLIFVMLFLFFLCWSLESLSSFCSNNHSIFSSSLYLTACFLWGLNDFFLNQILHLPNPHDKLSALCVSKFWVPKYLSTNPSGSKTRRSLSLLSYVGRRIRDREHEL
jgi:hypothetical protein